MSTLIIGEFIDHKMNKLKEAKGINSLDYLPVEGLLNRDLANSTPQSTFMMIISIKLIASRTFLIL